MKHQTNVRRVYGGRTESDGLRVLVDRLWPRGLTRPAADLDDWCKEVAPSTVLRHWYGHDPTRWLEFGRRYRAELADPSRHAALEHLRSMASQHDLTLLTATRDIDISHAVLLAQCLVDHAAGIH